MESLKFLILTSFAGLDGFIKIYIGLLTIRIYLGWFPNINMYDQPFVTIGKMTDPYLRIFRGIIPVVIGVDLSPIMGFLLLGCLQDFFKSFSFAA
jgi:YggT family protein